MPSLRKLAFSSNSILPKMGKDLTVYSSTPLGQSLEISSDSSMECTSVLIPGVALEFSVNKDTNNEDTDTPPVRKRQRLDHLSQEEKIMRRKMKNRVAAQSARDRKKAKMTELEEQVLELEIQNKFLAVENAELREKNRKLEEQNAELKLRLSLNSSPISSNDTNTKVCDNKDKSVSCNSPVTANYRVVEEGRSLEYASLINDPLLKEQDLHLLTLWMMQYVYLPAIARLMTFLICFNSAVIAYSNVNSAIPKSKTQELKGMKLPQLNHWWGPHQKAWNPSKN